MSRYIINSFCPGEHDVVVGWDSMLNTFFARVADPNANEEDEPVLWVGATAPQIHDIDELKRLLKPYAVIPYEIEMKLRKDSD